MAIAQMIISSVAFPISFVVIEKDMLVVIISVSVCIGNFTSESDGHCTSNMNGVIVLSHKLRDINIKNCYSIMTSSKIIGNRSTLKLLNQEVYFAKIFLGHFSKQEILEADLAENFYGKLFSK